MKHYKDENNSIWAYDDDYLGEIRQGLIFIDDEELAALRLAQEPPPKTTLQLDIEKYHRRAVAKPLLMAEMAAMNVGRIKDGTWSVEQLKLLMSDPEIKNIVSCMETLSFELAIQAIQSCTNALITDDIKKSWISRLTVKL